MAFGAMWLILKQNFKLSVYISFVVYQKLSIKANGLIKKTPIMFLPFGLPT